MGKLKSKTESPEKSAEGGSKRLQPNENEKIEPSFLDLRTGQGQVIFLLVSITLSVLVQLLPNDALRSLIYTNSPQAVVVKEINVCDTSISSGTEKRPQYVIYGKSKSDHHLRHVKAVLQRIGFEQSTNLSSAWDLMWAHDYPFRALYPRLHNLQAHQRVNHFPASGFLTNKVDLATTDLRYIPRAFRLPEQREQLSDFAKTNPEKLFVQKHNQHRNIFIRSIDEIDFNHNESFVQEFIDNPLLIDGHKFDIGVYVIITSVDPLRVYIYKGDVLFRFCPMKYYPFDAKNVDKYIVGDDYLPTWEVPSLAPYYNGYGFGMRDSFDAYMKTTGRNPSTIWTQVEDAIRTAILAKEKLLASAIKNFRSKKNFFEMMRFDLIIDNDFQVFLMEANMSPNLSSAHFLQNTLLYEQVLFNLMNLVGIGTSLHRESLRKLTKEAERMVSAEKNIVVFADKCASVECSESCQSFDCELCRPCLSAEDVSNFHSALREHINRGDTKRIIPEPIDLIKMDSEHRNTSSLSDSNRKMMNWFIGKCLNDPTWCS